MAFRPGSPELTATQNQTLKRQRIIEAAIAAFGRQGFYRTRIRDIATAAKVADGTVYLYFENKERLLAAIVDDVMERFLEQSRRECLGNGPVPDRIKTLLRLHLEGMGERLDIAGIFQVELRHSVRIMESLGRTHLHQYLHLIQEILIQGCREGAIRTDLDPWLVARYIFGILDEAVSAWVLAGGKTRLEDQVDPIFEFLMRGMKSEST
jgi:TetR/AcrR family fatty acid metabolism transcriptional regulator